MSRKYAVLKNQIIHNATMNISDYCEQFYSESFNLNHNEFVGVFHSLLEASNYATNSVRRDRERVDSNIQYPIYEFELNDENERLDSPAWVDDLPSNTTRAICSTQGLHSISRITHIYILNETTKSYEQHPNFSNVNVTIEWQTARYTMLMGRLKDFTSKGLVGINDDIKQIVEKLLIECERLNVQGGATHYELANALFLMDDAICRRIQRFQFESRLNTIQGYVNGSPDMQKLGIGLAMLGAALIATGLFLLCVSSPAAAAAATVGIGVLTGAAGFHFFTEGTTPRPRGLCNIVSGMIDDPSFFPKP